MALHFAEQKVNWLTHDVGDPLIGTPEFKVSAVRVEPVDSGGLRGGTMSATTADTLAFEAVDRHIRGRFGKPYLYEAECESTQLLLLGSGLPRARSRRRTTRREDAAASAGAGRRRGDARSSSR